MTTLETKISISTGDDSPATHKQIIGEAHWRRGTSGFAEINPGHGNPRYRQEWLVTDWSNSALNHHPFVPLKEVKK